MVALTPRNSIPYPQQTDVPNEATAMANMVGQIDRRMIPRFVDTTDRTTRVPSPSDGMIGYLNSRHQFEIYRNGAWQFLPFSRTVSKPSDTNRNTTTTTTADPHLTISNIVSGRTYLVEVFACFQGDPGVDCKVALAMPAGSSGNVFFLAMPTTQLTVSSTSMAVGSVATSFSAVAVTPDIAFGTRDGQSAGPLVQYIVTTTATGSFTVNWAQNVSSALNLTLQQGSYIQATVIA